MTAAAGLAPEWYTKGEPFMQEKAKIFATHWLPLAAQAQLAKRGDFAQATIGGWPLVVLRADAQLNAFRNTCRHQQMMVVEQPAGTMTKFQCRYHGWIYDLDGHFVEAPPLVAPADPKSEANDLVAIDVASWSGIAMVNMQRGGAPIDALPLAGALPDFAGAVTTDLACNWKVIAEMRLADAHAAGETERRYVFPIVALRRVGGGVVVEQIMARSFVRTRLVAFAFGAEALAWAQAEAVATKARAESLQAERAQGALDDAYRENAAIAALHQRVRGLTA